MICLNKIKFKQVLYEDHTYRQAYGVELNKEIYQ